VKNSSDANEPTTFRLVGQYLNKLRHRVISNPSSSSVITKSSRRKRAGHTVGVGEIRNGYQIFVGEYEDKAKLIRLRYLDGKIISKIILKLSNVTAVELICLTHC